MKLTFVTVSSPAIKQLINAGKQLNERYPLIMDLKIYHAGSRFEQTKLVELEESLKNSDFIFIDLMGAVEEVTATVIKTMDKINNNPEILPFGGAAREYMKLGRFTSDSMKNDKMGVKTSDNKKDMPSMDAMKKMQNMAEKVGKIMPGKMRDMRNFSLIMKYFKLASFENIMNMLLLILKEYSKDKDCKILPNPEAPEEVEKISICDPYTRRPFNNIEAYEKFTEKKIGNRQIVMMLFYSHTYPNDTSACVRKIAKEIEKFADILPVAVSGAYDNNLEEMKKYIESLTSKKVDLIINFMSFRLGAGPMGGDADAGVEFLKYANAAYLHPFFMSKKTEEEWLESVQGCSPAEVMISVMLPELDGAIEAYPVGCMTDGAVDEEFDVLTEELKIIADRQDRLIGKIKSHLKLKEKINANKKVAIVGYNYPPGEDNLFGGAFLDTFASMENILAYLKKENYDTDDVKKEKLMEIFGAGGIVNSGNYDFDEEKYIIYESKKVKDDIDALRDEQSIKRNWGNYPGRTMISENERDFLIPGVELGNVFLGIQPSRGIHEDDSKTYHDKNLPPHYQYIAFYKWLRDEFKADLIIHIGTHGTIEFLGGKECGMSKYCYPDYLLGDCVHSYLYYCGNPSESAIAKRRSHANLVSYQPPTFIQGKLYGDYSKLKSTIDEYHHNLAMNVNAVDAVEKNIILEAERLNLPTDLDELEKELYRLDFQLIPKGLHIFGQPFNKEDAREYVRGVLRYNHGQNQSIRRIIAYRDGHDICQLEENMKYELVADIDEKSDKIFDEYFKLDEDGLLQKNILIDDKNLIATLIYGQRIYEDVQKNEEIRGLLDVLDDDYNTAKLSGDIYRNPDILPTGHNLYQFDPRQVPTKTAYERGSKIAENCIQAYYDENKTYPKSTAVVCWGIETSRTQGETFSQILGYLGVRISENTSAWDPKYEIIPLEEMKRPRIDVTINICGFFRDMFANLIDNISDVFYELYKLDESYEENYFKANTDKIYHYLLNEGYEEEEALQLALSRIFGPEAGNYGTGITKFFETKDWETEEEIGNLFMDNLQYVYNKKMHGKKAEGLYKENLKSVEIVSQIRSSHEYEITDLDHYYEFFGGLSKSVEMASGKKAKMYITDTTSDHMYTESVDKSIARGIRSRVLNPKWIDGMLEHKYHGVQHIADRFENVMGLAATTGSVDEWIYNDMHARYVEDEEMRKRLAENNPYAYMKILEQMMEYTNRGYWAATEEQKEEIKKAYLQIENNIEGEN